MNEAEKASSILAQVARAVIYGPEENSIPLQPDLITYRTLTLIPQIKLPATRKMNSPLLSLLFQEDIPQILGTLALVLGRYPQIQLPL